eukprot:gene10748-biopygen5884
MFSLLVLWRCHLALPASAAVSPNGVRLGDLLPAAQRQREWNGVSANRSTRHAYPTLQTEDVGNEGCGKGKRKAKKPKKDGGQA